MDLRVRDRKTGIERTVTHKAYAALGPKVYEKLGAEEAPQQPQAPSTPTAEPPITGEKSQDEADGQRDQEAESDAPAEVALPKRRPGRPARDKSISSNSQDDEK